ncbi:hypothetical protein A2239_02330 [Candidatus Uhrbacteria bacterium RIFOXYA2_FULL_40_9]|nr:MAG: hypothetical protein A2239_02330 [Candidatus Uhrbacteria bacterium RIFOXYA2_FULL_40_9]OGL96651.1 MAG: hypothetical protein A2332_01335 [Candidatus Uhrbacteria bacterium RIFOXYB2_FULL_41_18]HBK34729.1 hypothetical protein [Candidatus Uhrbacteria bacterium]HCB55856.1 hypothetical protein [Candidatus Uhrbacteria bacterium]
MGSDLEMTVYEETLIKIKKLSFQDLTPDCDLRMCYSDRFLCHPERGKDRAEGSLLCYNIFTMSKGAFTNIIGHEMVCQLLERILKNHRFAHAYLFIGPSNVGKTTVAEAFLKELMGITTTLESHPDTFFLHRLTDEKTGKLKTGISVKQIRELKEKLSMTSLEGGWKAVLIPEAHLMTSGAANALLKTLEEPLGKTMIILCAPDVSAVPQTIASRCQLLRFSLVAKEVLTKALQKRGLSPSQAISFSAVSAGRPGRALRLIQDGGFRAQMETAVSSTLSFFHASLAERITLIQSLLPKEESEKQQVMREQLNLWEQVLRDQLLCTIDCQKYTMHPSEESFGTKTTEQWMNILKTLLEVRQILSSNINSQLALEHIAFSL